MIAYQSANGNTTANVNRAGRLSSLIAVCSVVPVIGTAVVSFMVSPPLLGRNELVRVVGLRWLHLRHLAGFRQQIDGRLPVLGRHPAEWFALAVGRAKPL